MEVRTRISRQAGRQAGRQDNCINLIRLLAAFQVLLQHVSNHIGVRMPAVVSIIFRAFPGVPLFFMLSGF